MAKQQEQTRNVQERVATNGEVAVAERYSSPIPLPQTLAEYDRVVPGTAKDIIDDFKENSKAIRELNKRELELSAQRDARGQIMAFILALSIIGITVYAIYAGAFFVAGAACVASIAAVAKSITRK